MCRPHQITGKSILLVTGVATSRIIYVKLRHIQLVNLHVASQTSTDRALQDFSNTSYRRQTVYNPGPTLSPIYLDILGTNSLGAHWNGPYSTEEPIYSVKLW